MATKQELEGIVRHVLRQQLGGAKIDSFSITPSVDEDGVAVLVVKVVFDEERGPPDPRATSSLLRFLRPQLMEAGEDAFPVVSFIAKSELGKLKAEAG